MLEALREEVYRANLLLVKHGLVIFTWGNVSGIDRERGLVVIKPSGVPYEELSPDNMVIVDMEGRVVEGDLRPSTDTPTHIELYKAFPTIGGVTHTHSTYATAYAQACRPIPAYGTTHADYFYGDIPCTRAMSEAEISGDYEAATGRVIAEALEGIDPLSMPAALVHSHGPFVWAKTPTRSAELAATLEEVARIAYLTEQLGGQNHIDGALLDKHFLRKHGSGAYYGQKSE
ncbi:MAG TPA: L-ribulose-5-phosphate 4-epimerase [Bacillota bacterium]|nr:L-ribulose-5-phosphate 4-epimerase [Clostridiales bacterium]HPT85213.1 L-ribulose-5-phosphate 4-epimerase [Bacillota bacterium]